MTTTPIIFDRNALTRRRNRAALSHTAASNADFLLARAADELLDRLAVIKRHFSVVAVVGAHGDMLAERMQRAAAHETILVCDAARHMLPPRPFLAVQADEEMLPFRPASLDLIVSALSLQWVNDLPGTLAQMRSALKPDGLLLAALVGGDSLAELRQSFVAAESEREGGASPRVAPFADGRDLGALLQRAGFALPVVDSDRFTVAYRHPLALMHDLRAMGATNVLAERRRAPLRRNTLARACEIYAERFSRPDGKVLATFEIIALTAWAPADSQPKPLRPGSATHRLADALGTPERKLVRE